MFTCKHITQRPLPPSELRLDRAPFMRPTSVGWGYESWRRRLPDVYHRPEPVDLPCTPMVIDCTDDVAREQSRQRIWSIVSMLVIVLIALGSLAFVR